MAAPLQPGIQYTLADLKYAAGTIAVRLRNDFAAAENLRVYLVGQPDADLVALGLTQPMVDIIKGSYVGELPSLRTSFNALTWTKQLFGLGV